MNNSKYTSKLVLALLVASAAIAPLSGMEGQANPTELTELEQAEQAQRNRIRELEQTAQAEQNRSRDLEEQVRTLQSQLQDSKAAPVATETPVTETSVTENPVTENPVKPEENETVTSSVEDKKVDEASKEAAKTVLGSLKDVAVGTYDAAQLGLVGISTVTKNSFGYVFKSIPGGVWGKAGIATFTVAVIGGSVFADYKWNSGKVTKKCLGTLKSVMTSKWTWFGAFSVFAGLSTFALKGKEDTVWHSTKIAGKTAGATLIAVGALYGVCKLGGWALRKFSGLGFGKKAETPNTKKSLKDANKTDKNVIQIIESMKQHPANKCWNLPRRLSNNELHHKVWHKNANVAIEELSKQGFDVDTLQGKINTFYSSSNTIERTKIAQEVTNMFE